MRARIALAALACPWLVLGTAAPALGYPRPGKNERVAVNDQGVKADGPSRRPVVSADGRYVAFYSFATNLAPNATSGEGQVYLRDRLAGTTELISIGFDGLPADGRADQPALSPDGRFVAFATYAGNIVPGDVNGTTDIFLRDRLLGTTELISVATSGAQGDNVSGAPSLSADGRIVAFHSHARNLVDPDGNLFSDVFVRDRLLGTTRRISVNSAGDIGFLESYDPSVSADGRWVAFQSLSYNLVPDDTNGRPDVFVADLQSGKLERISTSSQGAGAGDASFAPWISADGRFVSFTSAAANLVPRYAKASGKNADVYVHDRRTGATERVSVASQGLEGNENAGLAGIPGYPGSSVVSADGRFVAFYSFSTNHVTDDTSLAPDVFVRDRALGVTTRDHVRDDGLEAEFAAEHLGMSADGRIVGLQSAAVDLIPSDPGNGVFVRDRGPANGTGRITATVGEGQVAVSGWANFAGVVVSQGADPGTDGVPGAYANGGELTGAGLTTRPESADLLLRWSLAGLPPAAAGVLYGFDFALGGTPYQVTAVEPSTFVLSRCTPACTPIATVGGAIGTTGSELHVSVPVAALGGVAGMQLTGVRAFTALGGATLDELSLPAGSVPTPSVALGIAGDGVPESGVAFESPASLSSGYFSGTVSTAGLPGGDYRVWARACLGATCQAASAPVTLTGTVAVEPGPAGGPAFSTLSVAGAHPLRHVASLQYAIGRDAAGGGPVEVMLELHDLQGRRLHTLKRGRVGVGRYRVIWDLRGPSGALMAPGVYYARLRAGAVERVTKLVVIE